MKATYSKKSKYRSRKVTIDGVTYDSIKEYHRFCDLKLLERAGIITGLQRQVKYTLIPSQFGRVPDKQRPGGIKRVCLEREVSYYADFVYKDVYGNLIVEDAKGFKTKEYIIKRKLMLERYGIRISEV